MTSTGSESGGIEKLRPGLRTESELGPGRTARGANDDVRVKMTMERGKTVRDDMDRQMQDLEGHVSDGSDGEHRKVTRPRRRAAAGGGRATNLEHRTADKRSRNVDTGVVSSRPRCRAASRA